MNFSFLQEKAKSLLYALGRLLKEILFHSFSHFKKWASIEKNLTPEERSVKTSFFFSAFLIGGVMFFMTSVSSALEKEDVGFWPKSEMDEYDIQGASLAEEGFFAKTNTPTYAEVDRSSVATITKYEVQPGDTLEMIANRFAISTTTILNNNAISNPTALESGMVLKILPVNGVLYEVQSGDTINSIAQEYALDVDVLTKQNQRGGDVRLIAGSFIILPGVEIVHEDPTPTPSSVLVDGNAKNIPAPTPKKKLTIAKTNTPTVPAKKTTTTKVLATPKNGKKYVWPVVGGGSVTQGYHPGHYAIDVWGADKPGILAIASGTVIKSSAGCGAFQRSCNGGYGNVIIIDHGNGVTSLYAHNTELYVSKGDTVSAGQLIAKMGNSGNVYGKTGIHLHFELSIGGKKRNPLSYL